MLRETKIADNANSNCELEYIDKEFVLDCLGVPTSSGAEFRMQEFIILWARRNGILCSVDKRGNIYLTKGIVGGNEYYPCVTSHMDTVHYENKDYAELGVGLRLKVENEKGKTKVSAPGLGIGADDKAGICISLTLMGMFDKIKACFFVEEETGCRGSSELDSNWFDDVGYVIGWDSPDLNRAAWKCGGIKLFSYDFYKTHIKEICDRWGLTKFYSEPITDVMNIRTMTEIVCMNFGNGGYRAHSIDEYCILEDMDHAAGMGADLIRGLGMDRYEMAHVDKALTSNSDVRYWIDESGIYHSEKIKDDDALLAELGDGSKFSYSTTYKPGKKLSDAAVRYVIDTYEEYISNLEESVMDALTEAYGGDKDKAQEKVNEIFNKEITE